MEKEMLAGYSGATRIYPILGDPIAQVKSPSGLTLAFEKRGYDAIVVPMQVATTAFTGVMQALRHVRNVDGFIATVPHKFAAFDCLSSASERARLLGSANVARREPDGGWHGDVLDGLGFIGATRRIGFRTSGARALLVGAGGAGGAIGMELLNSGVHWLGIHDSDIARRDSLLDKLAGLYPWRTGAATADPSGFEIVVNATPLGMADTDPSPIDLSKLRSHMLVGDVITRPKVTRLLATAQQIGCMTQNGVEMFDATVELTIDFFVG